MNIRITPSAIALARDVTALSDEEVARLAEDSGSPSVIGIFPTGYENDPWRAHLLCGEPVDDVSEGINIFRFESSLASFRVKQFLRRRDRKKSKQRGERVAMNRVTDLIEGGAG